MGCEIPAHLLGRRFVRTVVPRSTRMKPRSFYGMARAELEQLLTSRMQHGSHKSVRTTCGLNSPVAMLMTRAQSPVLYA